MVEGEKPELLRPAAYPKRRIEVKTKMKRKHLVLLALLAIILAVPMFSRAAGADTVTSATPPKTNTKVQTVPRTSAFPADKLYTLQEMLTYAIKAEYAAQALYTSALALDAQAEPFGRLLRDTNTLVDQLTVLLKNNGFALPEAAAVPERQTFTSLEGVCLAAIEAQKNSIEMYKAFLTKESLPLDVRQVFQLLLGTSQSHLEALMTAASNEGWLQTAQYQDDRDDDGSEYEDDDDDDGEYEDDDDAYEDSDDDEIESEEPDDGDDD